MRFLPRRADGWGWLRPWPLLIASVAAFVGAVRLLTNSVSLEYVAFALIAAGAVCLGAWIAMLAAHDYPGGPYQDDRHQGGGDNNE